MFHTIFFLTFVMAILWIGMIIFLFRRTSSRHPEVWEVATAGAGLGVLVWRLLGTDLITSTDDPVLGFLVPFMRLYLLVFLGLFAWMQLRHLV